MSRPAPKMIIGLAGSFTVDPLAKHIGLEAEYLVAPYNQITQLSFNPAALLGDAPDVLVVIWRLEDIGFSELDNFIQTIKNLRESFKGTLIVSNCPYPSTAEFNTYDLQQPQSGVLNYAQALDKFTSSISKIDNINILNLAGLMSDYGVANAHDIRKWYLYKQPYAEKFWEVIGVQVTRIINAQTIASKKCIVLDCDNTLWGGIIGEDGIGGIELGQDFPGSAFKDFQKHALHLRSKGLFLAIASKNDETAVFDVFDNHDAMILKREHISSWQVHWNSKADSIQAIADDLNIGLDAIVFVDDNPKEIAEVESRLPDVTCLIVPEEIAELPRLLVNTGLFDIADLTEEDAKRADMMASESKRKSASTAMTQEEFIQSLELKIKIFEVLPQHLGRITQLINKTNQFNVTTKRRTADEVKALSENSDILLMGMDIADRFGEYGLVGVAIAQKQNKTEWFIDSLMMSCRVLGRGAETSLIAKLAEAVSVKGGEVLIGEYIPTPKNSLVEHLYKDHGFNAHNGLWKLPIKDAKSPPAYVDVTLEIK